MGSIPTNLLNNIYLYPPNQYSQHFHSHLLTHTEWQKVSGLRYMARVEPEVEPGKAMSFSFSKCPFHSLFSSMNLCVCVCVCVCAFCWCFCCLKWSPSIVVKCCLVFLNARRYDMSTCCYSFGAGDQTQGLE
jgi:hypothetical protein